MRMSTLLFDPQRSAVQAHGCVPLHDATGWPSRPFVSPFLYLMTYLVQNLTFTALMDTRFIFVLNLGSKSSVPKPRSHSEDELSKTLLFGSLLIESFQTRSTFSSVQGMSFSLCCHYHGEMLMILAQQKVLGPSRQHPFCSNIDFLPRFGPRFGPDGPIVATSP